MDIAEFVDTFDGDIIRATDDGYQEAAARSLHASVPKVIVRPRSVNDVVRAVMYATHNDLEVSVRCGGHGVTPHSDVDGVLIDMSLINDVDVLDDNRVRIGGGAVWGDVATALAPHRLVITAGDTKDVGVGGLTLGGGVGLFVRTWGLALDNLLEAEVVTASGEAMTVNAETNADLFWAVRGGGGNFGVVTSFVFQAYELEGIVSGTMSFSADAFVDVLRTWRQVMRSSDETLNTTVVAMPAMGPEMPASVSVSVVQAGVDEKRVLEVVAPLLALDGFLQHDIKRMEYADALLDGMAPPPHLRFVTRNGFSEDLHDDAITALAELRDAFPTSVTLLRWTSGAFNRVLADATAFSWRDGEVMVMFAPIFTSDDPVELDMQVVERWGQFSRYVSGCYLNFLNDAGPWVVEASYSPVTLERLRQIKTKYDPQNVFHQNNNIVPLP